MKSNKLNIGSGADIRKGYINLDIVKLPGVDVVWDVDKYPWPFESGRFEEIIAYQILEHVEDPLKFLEEVCRVSKDNAKVVIETPHHASGNAYADVSHKNFFNLQAFINLTQNKDKISNEEVKSKKIRFNLESSKIELIKFKFLERLINKFNKLYDYGLCYIVRPVNMRIVLRVAKRTK